MYSVRRREKESVRERVYSKYRIGDRGREEAVRVNWVNLQMKGS